MAFSINDWEEDVRCKRARMLVTDGLRSGFLIPTTAEHVMAV
jgi:hypothetical protein